MVWVPVLITADLRGPQGLQELFDRPGGDGLDRAGDGEGGEQNDGEVGLDRVSGSVVDRAGGEVGLGHPERGLDVPQVPVGRHHTRPVEHHRGDVGHIALESGRGAGPLDQRPVHALGRALELHEAVRADRGGAGGDPLGPFDLLVQPLLVTMGPRRRAPDRPPGGGPGTPDSPGSGLWSRPGSPRTRADPTGTRTGPPTARW